MEHKGFKIGFLGFAEDDWINQFPADIDVSDLECMDLKEALLIYA